MVKDDAELLAKARAGDAAALERLLAMHEHGIYRFGLRMCGSEERAKEVLQQTLLAAFRNLHAFKGEARLSTWLYQIARSFCVKTARRRADAPDAHISVDEEEAQALASERLDPEDTAHAREIGEVLQAAIRLLPETYREALILRDVEGLSAEEAAEVAGIEVANLKSRLHRARLEVRKHLSILLEPTGDQVQPCPQLAAELSAFVAEEIDKATCEKIEAHLATCPNCAAACTSLKQTVSLCRRIPGDEVPPAVRQAVRSALHAATGPG